MMIQTGIHANDRKQPIAWARALLSEPFLILDTETTHLDHTGEITQIAVIDHLGLTHIDTYVKPYTPIDENSRAFKVSGISQKMVEKAPCFADIYPTLTEILSGQKVVIYNAEYDTRLIRQSIKQYQRFVPASKTLHPGTKEDWQDIEADWIDAMIPYSIFAGEWNDYHGNYKWQKLPGTQHGALEDCKAVLTLIKRMADG